MMKSQSTERVGAKVHEMIDLEVWKWRREEMLREAKQNRLAKALRNSRRQGGGGRVSTLLWELRRVAGRLRKLSRSIK